MHYEKTIFGLIKMQFELSGLQVLETMFKAIYPCDKMTLL